MLFGFRKQFGEHVLSGRKSGTCRKPRLDNKLAKTDEACHLHESLRTKQHRFLGVSPCVFTTSITVATEGFSHGEIRGLAMSDFIKEKYDRMVKAGLGEPTIKELWAWAEGFENWDELLDFFQPTKRKPWKGYWTTWQPLA